MSCETVPPTTITEEQQQKLITRGATPRSFPPQTALKLAVPLLCIPQLLSSGWFTPIGPAPPPPPTIFYLTTSVDPPGAGSTSPSGSVPYSSGQTAIVTATAVVKIVKGTPDIANSPALNIGVSVNGTPSIANSPTLNNPTISFS